MIVTWCNTSDPLLGIVTMHNLYVSSPVRNCATTEQVTWLLFPTNHCSQSACLQSKFRKRSRKAALLNGNNTSSCSPLRSYSLFQPAIGFVLCCHEPKSEPCLRHAVRTVEHRSPAYALREVVHDVLLLFILPPNVVTFLLWFRWLYIMQRSDSSHGHDRSKGLGD